ncbi:MAG: N-acetyltransferase family protein [Bacteroidota bacterium]
MDIRLARPGDLQALVAILNTAVERRQNALLAPVTVESRTAWLDTHPPEAYPMWVASGDGGSVAGWGSLNPWRSGRGALRATAEVSVYVAPDRQRQGVGTALLRHAIQSAPALGIDRLLAIGLETNTASLALFSREGFERWGALPYVAVFGGDRVGQWILGRAV